MFERRLKTFLGILLAIMAVLLLRAAHLQVVTKAQWIAEAEDFNKRPVYLETTRGRILDHNGLEIAVDDPCMDACVDYRAICRDRKWMGTIADQRLRIRLAEQYTKAPKAKREEMLKNEVVAVNEDIDAMWDTLGNESGLGDADHTPREMIDEVCHTIDLKVAMRTRYVQYLRYKQADQVHDDAGPRPWYRRWIIEGGNGGPKVDDFEQQSNEQVDVHTILPNISNDTMMRLAKVRDRCPGLVLKPGTNRRYPFGRAGAHLIGQLSPVTKQDLLDDPNLDSRELSQALRKYDMTDLVGRGGLEGLGEPTLRGSRGQVLRQMGKDDELVCAPVAGRDIRSTIDIKLQAEIQQMFAKMEVPSNIPDDAHLVQVPMHGAAVVIDIKTSRVRALVSYPDYDANELASKYEQLAGNELDAVLMNRATQSQLEPGSTIKPAVGLGAITQGVITPTTGIECTGFLVLDGHRYPNGRCWVASRWLGKIPSVSHHPIPIPHAGRYGNPDGFLCYSDALERSCNVFFETCAHKLGIDGLSYWLDKMGLGHETGIGIAEACGRLPRDVARGGFVPPSMVWFSGIGQSGVLATPIQMANVSATIARDGIWMRPQLVETDGAALSPSRTRDGRDIPDRIDLGLSKEGLAAAREGMTLVVNDDAGTGNSARMANLLVAGKTGTAQAARILEKVKGPNGRWLVDEHGKIIRRPLPAATMDHPTTTPWYRGWGADGSQLNHAWFIGFAPAKDPQIAFAVMIQYGGNGGFAAKTATQVLQSCIKHGYVTAHP